MEGYTNSGFNHSISGLSLKTRNLPTFKTLDGHYAETLREAAGVDSETDLDSGSFLSDLEKDSGRKDVGAERPAVMAGYCDRSFEKAILTFTNEEATLDLTEPDGRQGATLSVAAPSMNTHRLRGSRRFTPRPAPETIPEEESEVNIITRDGEGRISLQLEDAGRRKQKPQPRLSNLCGLIDTNKLISVLGGRTVQTSAPSVRPGLAPPPVPGEAGERRGEAVRLSGSDLASSLGLLALVLLIISHASPSWLVSWEDTASPFVRMGPWQICFNRFRFPRLQFDVLFNGCSSMWGQTYHQIREWLMPPWLLAVQGLLCLSLILSCLSRLISLLSVFQSPRDVWLRFGYYFLLVNVFCDLLVGLVLFTASLIFCFSCWSRSWLLYPNYNYLSWGWAAALLASWAHLAATLLFLAEARRERARRPHYEDLLLQLQSVQPGMPGLYQQEGIYI